MKKIIRIIVIAIIVLILLAMLSVHLFLDGAIKRGVETVGPKLTKTNVKLNVVSVSLFSGSGKMKGLTIGNPEGFKSPSAIQVGTAALDLQPRSIFSDKVVIKSIAVEGPQITFETDLKTVNLKKILNNLDEASGGSEKNPSAPKQPEAKEGKKLEVDDFSIKGGKVHVVVPTLNQSTTVDLPEIHLQDLGKDSNGITAAELSKRVLAVIVEKAEQQSSGVIADMVKGGKFMGKDLNSSNAVESVTKGLGGLLKKKQ